MRDRDLCVGTSGWEHDDWVGGFYPDNLPDDWRLAYYSNLLRSVLLPLGQQNNLLSEDIQTWPDDIYPEFRFVVEIDLAGTVDVDHLIGKLKPVSGNIDAWLLCLTDLSSTDPATIVDACRTLAEFYPVSVFCRQGEISAETLGELNKAGASLCWSADKEDAPRGNGNYLVTLTAETNGKAQRDILQAVADWAEHQRPDTGAAVFFMGAQAAHSALQARTVAELMGI